MTIKAKQLSTFGKVEHKLLTNAILEKLKEVEKEFGVELTPRGGTVGSFEGVVKLGVKVLKTTDGKDTEEANWDNCFALLNLQQDDFGKVFVYKKNSYKIVGADFAKRLPVKVLRLKDQKRYAMDQLLVREMLGR